MAKLEIKATTVDEKVTAQLRALKKLPARPKGDLESAILSAAHYAKKLGVSAFAYHGNSYGRGVWNVTTKPGDWKSRINNQGSKVAEVTPALELRWHEVA